MIGDYVGDPSQHALWCRFRIFVWNHPLPRPGCYLVIHIASLRVYVGISRNVAKRLRQHSSPGKSCPKLRRATKKYGNDAFLAFPIFYTDEPESLLQLEEELIGVFDSVKNGFNIMRRSVSLGPAGPEFGAIISASLSRPETKAKKSARMTSRNSDPAVREELSRMMHEPARMARLRASTLELWNDPAYRANRSAAAKAHATKPEEVARKSIQMATLNQDAEFTEKRRAAMRRRNADPQIREQGRDRLNALYADPDRKAVRDALVRTATQDPARNAKISAKRKQGRWITDGTRERFIPKDAGLPDGWWYGLRKPRRSH